ncbi:MAG: hypothetical protein QM770_13845 [Tepidisphaeraceae bacterium]
MTPTLLIHTLEGLRGRIRAMSVLYGLGIVLGGVVGSLAVVTLLDYLLHLPWLPRLVLLIAAFVVTGVLAARFLVPPLRSKLTLSDVAGRAEQVFPQFEDRLRSAVEFSRTTVPGSQEMQARVLGEAGTIAQSTQLNALVQSAPMWRALATGVGALLLMVLILLGMDRSVRGILLSRLFNPFTAAQWPRVVKIDFVSDLPTRVASGGNVDVKIRLARGDRANMRPIALYQIGDGPIRREFMTRGKEPGTFALSLPAKLDSEDAAGQLKVWVEAGDDATAPHAVTIVPKLQLRSIRLDATSPDYVRPAQQTQFDLSRQQAAVLEGAAVTLDVSFNKPLAIDVPNVVRLVPVEGDPINASVRRVSANEVALHFAADRSLRFKVEGVDADGFTSSAGTEYELVVRPDQPPAVFIENPRRSEDRTVESTVPLVTVIEDDAGLADAKLIVSKLGKDGRTWEVPLVSITGDRPTLGANVKFGVAGQTGDRTKFRASFDWAFASALPNANLQTGDVLEYYVSVHDNFRLGERTHAAVESGRLRITIISQEELTARAVDELRQVKQQVQESKQRQDSTVRRPTTSARTPPPSRSLTTPTPPSARGFSRISRKSPVARAARPIAWTNSARRSPRTRAARRNWTNSLAMLARSCARRPRAR